MGRGGWSRAEALHAPLDGHRGWGAAHARLLGQNGEARMGPGQSEASWAVAARTTYLSLDRPNLEFAAKAACRRMNSTSEAECCYRVDAKADDGIVIFLDSDWGLSNATSRSMSGGLAAHWGSVLKSWRSLTQAGAVLGRCGDLRHLEGRV